MSMTSSRPYIIRALYEWILDNNCTPYVLVNALADGVDVPQQYVKNGQIVLNIAPVAVMNLQVNDDDLTFNGRFGGVPTDVFVPMAAVMGIYARENGQGMVFEQELPEPEPPGSGPGSDTSGSGDKPSSETSGKSDQKNKPGLRVVK